MTSPHPYITSNDRNFTCGKPVCGDTNTLRTTIGTIDLDAEFLNIDEIRDNFRLLIASVSEAVADVFAWIDRMEHEFAIKYAANEITSDGSLFNQINVAIVKTKRLKSSMNQWLSGFHQLILDTSELTNEYNIVSTTLRTESITSHANILQSAVATAKQNVGKSRSLSKKIKQILKLDSQIKSNLVHIQSQVESFYTGTIRLNDTIINFREYEQMMLALSGTDSPLAQIQAKLASDINSTHQPFSLQTKQPNTIAVPETNCVYGICDVNDMPQMKLEKLIERLNVISNRVLYTDNTKVYLDQVIDSAIMLSKNSDRIVEIRRLMQKIKNNTPAKAIEYFRANVRNPNGQYTRMSNIKQIINNLRDDDKSYAPILAEIYAEMEEAVKARVTDDSIDMILEGEDTEMRESTA